MIWILLSAFVMWSLIFVLIDNKVSFDHTGLTDMKEYSSSLSVIIVMRNEANHIADCLRSIDSQVKLPLNTEVILVDDHSEDDSVKIAESFLPEHYILTIRSLEEQKGKKNGIRLGLSLSKGDLIYFTDADCQLETSVLSVLGNQLVSDNYKAVFGPVQYRFNNYWQRLLAAENLNNQCVTESFIRYKWPIMANGANMMITRNAVEIYLDSLDSGTASGDDVFFAQLLGDMATCNMNATSSVWTNAPRGFGELIQQRLRWAAKSTKYPSLIAKTFGGVVFLTNLVFLASLLIIPFVNGVFWICCLVLTKALIEYACHKRWFYKYSVRHKLLTAFMLSILYPFYVVFIGLFSTLGVGYNWKGRYIKR